MTAADGGGAAAGPGRATRLSRIVSHALRHEPWVYELELDEAGWVGVDALLRAVRELGEEWSAMGREDLEAMLAGADKQRHELAGDRIRALYGHSLPGRIVRVAAAPPALLFHGTSPGGWELIRRQGLRPMARQFVHMSVDVPTALAVGRRKAPSPVILQVDAGLAHHEGVPFWRGNDKVWLTDQLPARFLTAGPTPT